MSKLLTASFKGREETFRTKLGLSFILTLAVYCLSYIPQMVLYVKAYGEPWSTAPVNSIMMLKGVSLGISITGAVLFNYFLKLIGLIMVSTVTLWLSCHSFSVLYVLLGSTAITVLPQLFSAMGLLPIDWISLNFLLYQPRFLTQMDALSGTLQLPYYGVYLLIAVCLTGGMIVRIRKRWTQP